jgi:general secretion pathway protein F
MPTYEYRGFDRGGRQCRGLVEAMSLKEAREQLCTEGILAERLSSSGRHVRFTGAQRTVVYHQLAALLRAGIPLLRALDLLVQSPELGDARGLLAGVRDRVRDGSALSDALTAVCRSVTPYEEAVIRAAEQSAAMQEMLERLGQFLEQQERLRHRVRSALVYPCIVVAAGLVVVVLQLGVLLPRTRELLSAGGGQLPVLTRMMIGFGEGLLAFGLPLLAAAVIAVLALRQRIVSDPAWRLRWDRMLFRLPLIGAGRVLLVNVRFARTMAILLQGGASPVESLRLSGLATGSVMVKAQAEGAAERVRQGSSVSGAVRHVGPLADTLPGWIEVGENTGNLGAMLATAANGCEERWERFIQQRLSLLEPVLLLVIGGFVLLVTLAVLLPVLNLTRSVGM